MTLGSPPRFFGRAPDEDEGLEVIRLEVEDMASLFLATTALAVLKEFEG